MLDRILEQRKLHSIGVHAILLTAISFAVAKTMTENGDNPLPKKIICGWTIDSRKLLKEKYKSPQPLGMFIGTNGISSMKVPKPFHVTKDKFWKRAKNYAKDVTKIGTGHKHDNITMGFYSYMAKKVKSTDFGTIMSEMGMSQFQFQLSNLSNCSPGPDLVATGPKFVDADQVYFGVCGHGMQSIAVGVFCTTIYHNDRICLAVCYNKKWLNKDFVRRFTQEIDSVLDIACS